MTQATKSLSPLPVYSPEVSALRAFFAVYGYEPLETPLIQPADLFLTRAGDQIINRLFTFERRGQFFALRPEFTSSAAHLYLQRYPNGGTVVRWQFSGSIFEDDPAAANGEFQRYSVGVELIGMDDAVADAEIIALAAAGLARIGHTGCIIAIGDVQLMRALLAPYRLDARTERFLLSHLSDLADPDRGIAYVAEQIDRLLFGRAPSDTKTPEIYPLSAPHDSELNTQQMLDVLLDATQGGTTMGGRTRHDIARRLVQKRQRAAERDLVLDALGMLRQWAIIRGGPEEALREMRRLLPPENQTAAKVLDRWAYTIELLNHFAFPPSSLELRAALARSWEYYTGLVFEIALPDGKIAAGGGRYDELVQLLGGGVPVPAVGFAYYAEALGETTGAAPAPRIALIGVDNDNARTAIQWSEALRRYGARAALIPASAAASGSEYIIQVHSDGTAAAGGKMFGFDEAEALAALINGNAND